jgi:DNA (cytosine-5)-methyltransferase 1
VRPRLLDLFCGAGGAAKGYQLAGFEVHGVDIAPQPRYVGEGFYQGDALALGYELLARGGYHAVHASPPCQDYSVTRSLHTAEYPRLIEPVRDMLTASGLPFVIENVAGAKRDLRNPVLLCGSSFGLGVRRHRLFETSWPVLFSPPCAHHLQPEPVDVTGTGGMRKGERTAPGGGNSRKPQNLQHAREVMGIDWMTRRELGEAIPPAFTEWIGARLLDALAVAA